MRMLRKCKGIYKSRGVFNKEKVSFEIVFFCGIEDGGI